MKQDPYLLYKGKLYGTGPSLKGLLYMFFFFSVRYDVNQDPYLLYKGKLYGTGPSLKGFTVHVFVCF